VPGGVVDRVTIFTVDVPGGLAEDIVTSVGLRDMLGPFGETVAVSLTSPVKPLMLSTLTMKLEFVAAEIVNDAGTADTPKSSGVVLTKTSTFHEHEIVPLDP
jgi:hypothetical protein